MKNCALLVNPAAGGGRFSKIRKRLYQLMKDNQLKVETFISESPGHFLQLAEELAAYFDTLLIAGGDSALTMALNAIKSEFPLIGFIPLGTCNDIARHFRLFPLESYLRKVKNGTFRTLPLAKISSAQTNRLFIGQCSCGAGELLNQKLTEQKERSALWRRLPPFLAGFLLFKKIQSHLRQQYFLQTEQSQLEDEFSLIVISLIDFFSCGLKIFDSTSSSQFRLLALKNEKLSFFLNTYLQLKRNPDFCSPQIVRLKDFSKITLRASQPFGLQYDGEPFSDQSYSEYRIEIVSQKLRLIS